MGMAHIANFGESVQRHRYAGISVRFAAVAAVAFSLGATLVLGGCAPAVQGAGSVSVQEGSAAVQQGSGNVSAKAGASARVGAVTFEDDLGRTVTVDNPQRVVVGMGSLADIWRDAGGSVVGVTDDAFRSFGFSEDEVEGVGTHSNLNLEAILALDPDFVLLTSGSSSSDRGPSQDKVRQVLENSGIPVAFFKVDTFDQYLHLLKICTQITGRDDLYRKNGAEVQARVEKTLSAYSVDDRKPSVLVVTASSKGAAAQKPDHLASLMLKQLGAQLLTEAYPSLLSDFSMESVAELDPDYIFVLPAATSDEKAQEQYQRVIEENPAWAQIGAVKDGRVTVLDVKHFFLKPNSEWDQAYETLGKALQR